MNFASISKFVIAAFISGLCLMVAVSAIACGGSGNDGFFHLDTVPATPTPGHSDPVGPTPTPDKRNFDGQAKIIHDALMKASFSAPSGFSGPAAKDFTVSSDQKKAGAVGAVQVTFSSPQDANVIFYIFVNADQASAFEHQFQGSLPSGPARKFLPYLTAADCADTSKGGTCALASGQIVIVATASVVDRGAAALMLSAKTMAEGAGAIPASPTPGQPTPMPVPCGPTSSSATAGCEQPHMDGCALMTLAEAQTIMHGAVGGPSRDEFGNCLFPSQVVAGDGVSVQVQTGGSAQYDHAFEIAVNAQKLSGIGDRAFLTASQGMPMAQVHILKGGRYVIVFVINSRDSALNKSATDAAKIVAPRIK